MFRPRIIPVLLLKGNVLVKSKGFDDYTYIGDPINAVRIFNEMNADELVFLDILATKEKRSIAPDFVKKVGEEAHMPFAVGGGISSIEMIREALAGGAEKVVIGAEAVYRPSFIKEASDAFGSSAITVCLDVQKDRYGKYMLWINNGAKPTGLEAVAFARSMALLGAGELIVQSITRDGSMTGYDVELCRIIADAVSIPVVALGGAGKTNDFKTVFEEGMASAVAGGSIFVYKGSRKGVLINYPDDKLSIFSA